MEKAGLIGLVRLRLLTPDDNLTLRGNTLQEAIDQDRRDGLIPFFVSPNMPVKETASIIKHTLLLDTMLHNIHKKPIDSIFR